MNAVNPLVQKQYTEWVYPEPIGDLAAWSERHCLICDPSLHGALIWPDRAADPELSILVAGCGTSQAAILAYANPRAQVTGIDISPPALAHTAALKTKHNLANLALREMDLHDASALGHTFDLVYCTGVLHHLPHARGGLAALAAVTAEDGAICAALYARYARAGIYMMQEALRRMKLNPTPDDIALVRQMIAALPPQHPAQFYIRNAPADLAFDGGCVDTFLHPEDHAFSVPDILALAAACGLGFQNWTDNFDYYPDGLFARHPAYAKIAALPDQEQWAVVELLAPFCGLHSFVLRKGQKPAAPFYVRADDDGLARRVPQRRHLLDVREEGGAIRLSRGGHRLRLEGMERDLFNAIDGRRTCGEIVARHAKGAEGPARDFFARMWRLGHLLFRCS